MSRCKLFVSYLFRHNDIDVILLQYFVLPVSPLSRGYFTIHTTTCLGPQRTLIHLGLVVSTVRRLTCKIEKQVTLLFKPYSLFICKH